MIADQNDPRATHIAAMDLRHRNWIESVLLSGRFDRVLEVGSYEGFSTVAFFNALRVGAVKEVHLCDIRPRPALLDAVRQEQSPHIHLHQCPSTQLLASDAEWDFILVDGLHTESNVLAELRFLLPAQLNLTCWHDTHAKDIVGCEGPQHALRAYQREGYYCTSDSLVRVGERTDRGLTFAAKTLELHEVVLEGYRKFC